MTDGRKETKAIIEIVALFLFFIGLFIVVYDAYLGIFNARDLALGVELQIIGLGLFILGKK